MKDQLLHFISYNDWANKKILAEMNHSFTRESSLFSHIIRAQEIWLHRIKKKPVGVDFFSVIPFDELIARWDKSLADWTEFLRGLSEQELAQLIQYKTSEGHLCESSLFDIVTQINNHSTHHRSQIALLLRDRGITPPATDYIYFTRKIISRAQ